MKKKIIDLPLDVVMSNCFGRYAKYIIQERALPDARDGLKPVQRRILFAMLELKLLANQPFKKSARVVGEVIGKFHPHGDSSIYEAMVRMSQGWKMNYPLIEMHGNNGSVDDDPAAAMRYTEARLSIVAEQILKNIENKTVKFTPNFDDSEIEPIVLPSIFPNMIVNGARGIAAGYATEMPPHNLHEVIDAIIAYINNPQISMEELIKIIPGPDFPTGGIVYSNDNGIENAFKNGTGKIIISSKYELIDKNKQKYLRIYEIPYGVNKAKLVKKIDEIKVNSQITGIENVIDQSDRNGIEIVVEFNKDANIDAIIKYLLIKTELQVYYHYNNIAIINQSPIKAGLIQLIISYYNHQKEVILNAITFKSNNAYKRMEIVNGFIKLIDIIDDVIEVIRQTIGTKKDVVKNLMNQFQFSELQADAIASLKLYSLTKTNQKDYLSEKKDLENNLLFYQKILTSEKSLKAYLIKKLKALKKIFPNKRRTLIQTSGIVDNHVELSELIKHEDFYISISEEGYLKKVTKKTFLRNKFEDYGLKDGDKIVFLDFVNTKEVLLCFTNLGNYNFIPILNIQIAKFKNYGSHINDYAFLGPNEKIINAMVVANFELDANIILATKKGKIAKIPLKDFFIQKWRKTFKAITIKKDDQVIKATITNGKRGIIIFTRQGKVIKYHEDLIPTYNIKTKGVNGISLIANDSIESFALFDSDDDRIAILTKRGFGKRFFIKSIPYSNKKDGRLIQLIKKTKAQKHLVDTMQTIKVNDEFFLIVDNKIQKFNFSIIKNTKIHEGYSKIINCKTTRASINNFDIVNDHSIFLKSNLEPKSEEEIKKEWLQPLFELE